MSISKKNLKQLSGHSFRSNIVIKVLLVSILVSTHLLLLADDTQNQSKEQHHSKGYVYLFVGLGIGILVHKFLSQNSQSGVRQPEAQSIQQERVVENQVAESQEVHGPAQAVPLREPLRASPRRLDGSERVARGHEQDLADSQGSPRLGETETRSHRHARVPSIHLIHQIQGVLSKPELGRVIMQAVIRQDEQALTLLLEREDIQQDAQMKEFLEDATELLTEQNNVLVGICEELFPYLHSHYLNYVARPALPFERA